MWSGLDASGLSGMASEFHKIERMRRGEETQGYVLFLVSEAYDTKL